jgi:hypothetical protein
MLRARSVLPFAFAALAAIAPAQNVSPELERVFALLDELDATDTSRLPFVRIATGWTHGYVGQPWRNTYRHGFLVADDGTTFEVRYLELDRERHTRTPAGTPEHSRVGFEPVDLREFAATLVTKLERSRAETFASWTDERDYVAPQTPMSTPTVALLAARACARCGFVDAANRLGRAADRDRWQLRWDLRVHLNLALADLALPWSELLRRHDVWLRGCTDAKESEWLRSQRDAIAAVVARRERRTRSDPPTDADLLEDLRDHLLPMASGGFDAWRTSSPLPAPPHAQAAFDRLVARGIDAVPALRAALTDESPTRSLLYSSRRGGSFSPRPLGRLAGDVLEAITGERDPGESWCADVRRDGLRAVLLRTLARGRDAAAECWLRRYPDDVAPVLARLTALEPAARLASLRSLVGNAREPARRALIELLRADARPDAPLRASACAALDALGDRSGYTDLVAAWRTAGGAPELESVGDLPAVLCRGGDGVWAALQPRLALPASRVALANALASLGPDDLLQHVPGTGREAMQRAVRACLAPLLADATPLGPRTVVQGRRTVDLHDATVADVAACTLASLVPQQFPFDPAAIGSVRSAQLARLLGRPTADTVREPVADAGEVVEVRLAPSTAKLGEATRQRLNAQRGARADATALLEALVRMVRDPGAGGTRAVLTLERAGRGRGTVLQFALEPSDDADHVELLCTVDGANRARINLGSSGLNDLATLRKSGVVGGIEDALDAPPAAPVEITVRLSRAR